MHDDLHSKLGCSSLLHIPCHTLHIVKPWLSDHIIQGIFLAFWTGGCLLHQESSAESSVELSVLLS